MTNNKKIVKCIRFTEDDVRLIIYLKSVNIRWTDLVYPTMHELLVKKCKEMKMKENAEEILPF